MSSQRPVGGLWSIGEIRVMLALVVLFIYINRRYVVPVQPLFSLRFLNFRRAVAVCDHDELVGAGLLDAIRLDAKPCSALPAALSKMIPLQ